MILKDIIILEMFNNCTGVQGMNRHSGKGGISPSLLKGYPSMFSFFLSVFLDIPSSLDAWT